MEAMIIGIVIILIVHFSTKLIDRIIGESNNIKMKLK